MAEPREAAVQGPEGAPLPDQPNPEAAISLRDVTRAYRRPRTSLLHASPPVHALRGVSFDVAHGEHFGIVGESGCGKSTLLRIMSGLDRATSGTVMVEGTDITRLPERRLRFLRERLQLVFQDPMSSLDTVWTVRSQFTSVLRGRGLRGDRKSVV